MIPNRVNGVGEIPEREKQSSALLLIWEHHICLHPSATIAFPHSNGKSVSLAKDGFPLWFYALCQIALLAGSGPYHLAAIVSTFDTSQPLIFLLKGVPSKSRSMSRTFPTFHCEMSWSNLFEIL